jgi:hypothetical protein
MVLAYLFVRHNLFKVSIRKLTFFLDSEDDWMLKLSPTLKIQVYTMYFLVLIKSIFKDLLVGLYWVGQPVIHPIENKKIVEFLIRVKLSIDKERFLLSEYKRIYFQKLSKYIWLS